MLTARRLISSAMPFLCIAFLLFSSVVRVPVKAAAACPEAPPLPLRVLYQRSAKVVVARVGNAVEGEVTEENEHGKWIQIRRTLNVHSTLKGEDARELVLIDSEYKENLTPAQPAAEAENPNGETAAGTENTEEIYVEENEQPEESQFAVGKRLLLFLRQSDASEDGYEPVDYRFGAKELSDADLRVYEQRLRELREIMASPDGQNERIVAWLIRCAEEPATRWEGVYELEESFNNFEIEQRHAQELKEKVRDKHNSTEDEVEELPLERTEEEIDFGGNPIFSQLLTTAQKNRLTSILLDATFEAKPAARDEDELEEVFRSNGLMELISLVKRWDGERLVPFLKANLATVNESNPYQAAQFMTIIAELLQNEKLTAIAQKYDEIAYEDPAAETPEVESEDNAESAEITENSPETVEPNRNTGEENTTEPETGNEANAAEEQTKNITYKQLREKIVNEFVAATDKILAKQQTAKK